MVLLNWIYSQGAAVVVPLALLIVGLIFRVPLKKTGLGALKTGVGFTALNAILGAALTTLSGAGILMAERFGAGLTIPDLGWGVFGSTLVFSSAVSMILLFSLIALNAVLVTLGITKTLNIDLWNHWPYLFLNLTVYMVTKNWFISVAFSVVYWFIGLKLADWSADFMGAYYDIDGITCPHIFSLALAPIGFFMDKFWDMIPIIKDIKLDTETLNRKLGTFGQPIVIGFIVGLIFGGFSYVGFDTAGSIGDQVGKTLQLALTLSFFMVLLPRACELIIGGLAPLSEGIRKFMAERMPGKKFYIGLDVAIVVGRSEHTALGAILVPFAYLVALLIPGNKVLPLADVAAYLIFFTVFAVNTNKGNLFRGILNSVLLWFPMMIALSNVNLDINMQIAKFVGFVPPEGVTQLTSLTSGSLFFNFIFLEIAKLFTGLGFTKLTLWATFILAIWVAAFVSMRNAPSLRASEIKKEKASTPDF